MAGLLPLAASWLSQTTTLSVDVITPEGKLVRRRGAGGCRLSSRSHHGRGSNEWLRPKVTVSSVTREPSARVRVCPCGLINSDKHAASATASAVTEQVSSRRGEAERLPPL